MFINFDKGRLGLSHRRQPNTLASMPGDFFSTIHKRTDTRLCCFVREKTIAAILLTHCPRRILAHTIRQYFPFSRKGKTVIFEDNSQIEIMSIAMFLTDTLSSNQSVLAHIAENMYGGEKSTDGNYVKFTFTDNSVLAIDARRLTSN